jgi:hypothetical protein
MVKYILLFASLMVVISLASCNLPEPTATSMYSTPLPSFPALQPTHQASATSFVSTGTTAAQTATMTSLTATVVTPLSTKDTPITDNITTTPQPFVPCDRAAPGDPLDVTIADDTHVLPGQAFSKTWRLVNDGMCPWTQEYAVVYFSGSQMSAKAQNNLLEEVQPGNNIDVSLDMIAPEEPGVYQGNWKLSNANGELFGLGPDGDAPFWVRVVVVEPATDTPIPPSPIPTATSTPVVYVTGEITLNPQEYLDLDTKTLSTGTTSDVYYHVIDKHTHSLEPVNNASLGAPGDTTPPTYPDCQAVHLGTDPLALDGLAINTTFCYRTNLGLPGWARLVSIDPNTDALTLEILTWTIP